MKQFDLINTLVNETLAEDPIDWGELSMNEDIAQQLVVSNVVEYYETLGDLPLDAKITVLLAGIAKLNLENFSLNMRLHQK